VDRAEPKVSQNIASGKMSSVFLLNNNLSNGEALEQQIKPLVWADSLTPQPTTEESESPCSSLPSFTSSVTEDVELSSLGVRARLGMRGEEDLEEQVEDLSQQVEQLLKMKGKLEAEVTTMKREHKREVADKEDELEDTRVSAAKRVKVLELQLEQEHEERLGFLRERHDMEGRIMGLKDALDHGNNEDQVRKLRKDLKKSKALLKDAQLLLERQGNTGSQNLLVRQLRNQLEDSEFSRTAALKAKGNCELDLQETSQQLEDICRVKADLEERCVRVGREKADLALHLKENEEEMGELLKKYKAAVAAGSTDQITIQDQAVTIQQLEGERNRARELLAEQEQKVEHLKGDSVSVAQHRRLELRLRELDSRLELEKTGRGRVEIQVTRLKEVVERGAKEQESLRSREKIAQEEAKKATKVLRDMREELVALQGRETEWGQRKGELEKQLDLSEAETFAARNELKVAIRRVEDLQTAIHGEMDSETDMDDSHLDSDDDTEMFLEAARRRIEMASIGRNRSGQSSLQSISSESKELEESLN